MKLDPGSMNLPVQALIGAILTSPDGVELGAITDVRISIDNGDKISFLLNLDSNVGIYWKDNEDYRIHFQGPS